MNLSELFGKIASEDAGVYRGLSLVLPPHIHKMVHDPEQPAASRAHLLLSEIRKQKETHDNAEGGEGPAGGLGSFWSPIRSKAEEFADQSGFQAYKEHELQHNCGDPDYGDGGCPTTRVVVHAQTPHEKHHWTEVFRPGERYDPDLSWRLPIRPGAPMRVRGISWRQGNDHLPSEEKYSKDGMAANRAVPYQSYDFMSEVRKSASAEPGPEATEQMDEGFVCGEGEVLENHRLASLGEHPPWASSVYAAQRAMTSGRHNLYWYGTVGEAGRAAQAVLRAHNHPRAEELKTRSSAINKSWVVKEDELGEPDEQFRLHLSRNHMHNHAVLHEMAHMIHLPDRNSQTDEEAHGPEFVRTFRSLLQHYGHHEALATFDQHYKPPQEPKTAGANGDLPEGLQLSFTPHYTSEDWLPRQDTGKRDTFHKVVAHVPGEDGQPVYAGEMSWYPHTGEVALVRVQKPFRRRGIGSAMWNHGLRMAKEHGLIAPRHSEAQTDAGKAWAEKTASARPGDYARREGEDYYDHETRVRHGLSMGHLTYDQAGKHGYRGGGREENTDSWTGKPNGKGWQPLPQELYHTTTNAAGVMEHGLKSAQELGHRNGHGLGGTPQWLSMTYSAQHAHNMLDALHEYHDHLNGKTSFADLHKAAQNGEGAQQPFHEQFLSAFGNEPDAARDARMKDKRIEPGLAFHEEAKEKGWEPHPEYHQNFGPAKDGRTCGSGWLRPATIEEKHEEYGAFSRARQFEGKGKDSILFLSNDRKAFAAKDPKNFAVIKLRPKPGAQGFPMEGEHEWRTGTGQAVEIQGEPIRRQASAAPSKGYGHEVDLDAMDSAASPSRPRGIDNEGHQVEMTDMDGWAHLDGSHGHEDNTTIGDHPVYTQDHTWLPNGRYWGPNSAQNDQRLFEGDHLRPEVREDILGRVDSFMRPRYRNWPRWTKVYFAGSEAAKWQPFNGDFDVLLGADFDTFRKENPEYADQPDDAIAKMITDGMWHTINVDGYWFTLADGRKVGPFDRTFFMSDRAWDIRNLKPYAAYNVTDDEWAVHPLEVPKDWDATHLPESYWTYAEAVLNEIKAIGTLPPEERHRMAANLWEELHTHRSDAFTGDGKGLFDLSNVIEKYLDQHPDKPWAQLVQWKNQSPSGSQPWVPTTARRTILTMLFDAKTKEPEGADYDGIMVAIVPPKSVGRKLLVEEGEPLEALHVTLVYLGDSSEYTRDQMKELGPLVRAWARTQKPLTARIGGAGTFHNVGEHVLWASVDIPGGGGVRHSLSELLEEHGYNVRNDHGWTPHITLKYHKHPVRFLPKVEPESWDVNEIMLCVGDEWMPVALGS